MKKKNLNQKLQLNKETIANLNNDQMNELKGGLTQVCTQVQTCGWKSECICTTGLPCTVTCPSVTCTITGVICCS